MRTNFSFIGRELMGLLCATELFTFTGNGASSTLKPSSRTEEERLWKLPPQSIEHFTPNPLLHFARSAPAFDVIISSDGRRIAYAVWKGNGRWFLRETNVTNDPRSAIDLFGFAEPAK